MRTALTVAPVFPGGRHVDPAGGSGQYTCVYVLGKPGAEGYAAGIDIDAFTRSGSSLLLLPPTVGSVGLDLTIEGTQYRLLLTKNERHEASAVRAQLTATNLLDAEARAYDGILPIVSWLSFRYGVGLSVQGWVVSEDATGLQRVRVGLLGESRTLAPEPIGLVLTAETRMLLAAYREASATSDIFLQALSYWKTIEGVYALRVREAHEALERGEEPRRREREQIPAALADIPYQDKWALEGFQPYLGKKFTSVRDDLRDRLRHGLAHLLPGDVNVRSLSADVFNDVSICEEVVPVLRYMAATLLTNHLAEADASPAAAPAPSTP